MIEQTTDYVPLLCRIFGHRMYEDIYPYGRLPAPVCGRRKCNHTTPGQEWRVRRTSKLPMTDEIYAAAGRAMLLCPSSEDEDADFFEWHRCADCQVSDTTPCPCSGIPWPSAVVRAAIDAALDVRQKDVT